MHSAKALRAIPIAAICALTLVLGGCASASDASPQSSFASSESSSISIQSTQSIPSASSSAQTASAQNDQNESEASEETTTMYITANGNRFEVELADNSSTAALVKLLEEGPITYTADDYGNFEKVGEIGHALPTNDTQINTVPGDVILYQGNKICIYYANNSWSFTKIGKIEDAGNLKERLGNGPIEVTLSLD